MNRRYITIYKIFYQEQDYSPIYTIYTFKDGLKVEICKNFHNWEIHSDLLSTFEYGTSVKEAWEAFSEMFHVIYKTLFESEYSNKLSESSLKLKEYLAKNCTRIKQKNI